MAQEREVSVFLLPEMATSERLEGRLAVVIDVLRATTTIVYALGAGCSSIRPSLEIEEARTLAEQLRPAGVLLAGERGGLQPDGFDLGNSPKRFTPRNCKGLTLVLTTTNGTKALLRCQSASRTLVAAFANYSAVCEQLQRDARPVAIICAGTDGDVTMEDALLAGAFVEFLHEHGPTALNDGARLAWDCFETHGRCLEAALELSQGGRNLLRVGFADDIATCAQIDAFALVPELRLDPLRIEVGSAGIGQSHWNR